jgi:PAS domain S-box-containing protein
VEAAGQAGHGILVLQNTDGREGAIVFVNAGIAGALGYTEDELLGMTIGDLVCPEDLPVVAERYAERQKGEDVPSCYVLRATRRDGTKVPLEISAVTSTAIDGRVSTLAFIKDISEHVHLVETLERSERRYRLLADNISDVIWVTDLNLTFAYVSPSVSHLLGYSVEEALSLTLAEVLTPASYEAAKAAFSRVLEEWERNPSFQAMPLEVEAVRKDGSTVWMESNISFMRDSSGQVVEAVGVLHDITERKQAEEALQLSEKKYRTLVESSPDGILSVDPQGCIVDCNMGVCKLLGYTRKDLKGIDVRLVVTKEALEKQAAFRRQIDRRGHSEAELEMVHRNGDKIPVWAKLVEVKGTKKDDFHILVYIRDMQERKKVDELKDQFIGLVSHELRTPLTVIIGAVNTALSEATRLPPQEIHHLLEDAANEADSLSHILENLLELSRSQADRLTLQLEPLMLEDVVQKTMNEARRHSSMHQFVMDLPKTLPQIRADRIRLERILHNLVENAVKYSPGGEVRVSARQEGENLVVEVHDQGLGMSPEDQAKLFRPFQRIRQGETDTTDGTGLGLLVCQSLVKAHDGRIWLESTPGQGTTFFFTIPIEASRRK